MHFNRLAAAVAATLMLGGPAAATGESCAAMNHIVKTARNDFAALRSLKMKPGICTFRTSEYKCRWTFPGDAFAVAEAQAAGMVQCAATHSDAPPKKLKRGTTLVALESDLSLLVAEPAIDMGQWEVTMRIVAGAAPTG